MKTSTILALSLVTAAALPAQSAAPTSPPSAQEIVARHAAAMGGTAAFERHSSLIRTGTLEIPAMGITGTYRLERAKPSTFRLAIEMATVGGRVSGFDGTTGWDEERGQRTDLTGPKLDDRRRTADFLADLRLNRVVEYVAPAERVEWQGCDCWRLKARTAAGEDRLDFYAIASGLYFGSEETVQSVVGAIQRQTFIQEWGTFDGVKLPIELVQRLPQFDTITRITETRWDAPGSGPGAR